jgi:hypothetical protein
MKNKNLYIGLGVAALAVIGYMMYSKKKGTTAGSESFSASGEEKRRMKNDGSAFKNALTTHGISEQEYTIINRKRRELVSKKKKGLIANNKVLRSLLKQFAREKNISLIAYFNVREDLNIPILD